MRYPAELHRFVAALVRRNIEKHPTKKTAEGGLLLR
jgi:hypothetical protein